ncbi:MAG: NAD(P)/FAD-dependent oxidoreductase [Actinomycetales bacterium]
MTHPVDRPERVVVVGAGLAGLRTVQELRGQGFDGSLVLIGAEPHRPYDRPPLSKELLSGETDSSELEAAWDDLDVELRLGVTVTRLDPERQVVVMDDAGEVAEVEFDACVLATGAVPLRIAGEPAVTLRTLDDALALRSVLGLAPSGRRLAVVGAGWIGAEVATVAAARGWDVDVIEAAAAPLHGSLPAEVAALTVPWYAAAGVELHLGSLVTEVVAAGEGGQRHLVRLDDGRSLEADVVLEGVGVRPATAWLADGGPSVVELDRRGAVLVDEWLRTSAPGVWATGDVAARWSPRYGRRLPGGHWEDALRAPATVAGSVLAGGSWAEPPGVEPYDAVPWVWSDHLGHSLQLFGVTEGRLVLRGDPSATGGGWSACWLDGDDRLRGVLVVDKPREVSQARRVVDSLVDPARLADVSLTLREAAEV